MAVDRYLAGPYLSFTSGYGGRDDLKNKGNTMNGVGYLRVSSEQQAESGAGLAAQRAAVEAFAKKQGIALAAVHADEAVSGAAGLDERPGLAAAIGSLRRGDVLVIPKRDRLGRDMMAVLTIERAVAKRGASILSADGVGNGDEAADKFMRTVIDAASAFERDLIKARTKAALAAKRRANQRTGEVPFGYRLADDATTLIPVPAEQKVIEQIVTCREAGMSLRQIAAILNDAATPTKKGGRGWQSETVRLVIRRQAALVA
jgi:DNA invertase Pin-like site-specific DNA recombinase